MNNPIRKRNYGIAIALIILVVSILGLCLLKQNEKKENPQYVFLYAENHPENYPTTLGAYKFAQLVFEKTEGRIEILVQANGTLGDEKSVIEQIKFGGIDFARVSVSPLADSISILNVLQLPYLYRDSEHMWKVLDGDIGEKVLQQFQSTGMIGLSWYEAGARNFYTTTKPIYTLEDMKGMKIRVQESDLMMDMVEALGAEAMPSAYGDVYSELQTGQIDGAENNWPSYESSGHNKVAKYYTVDEHTRVPEIQLCSEATWKQLSEQDQRIIRQCAKESAVYERTLWSERERKSEELVKEQGTKVIVLNREEKKRFESAVEILYQKYCAENLDLIKKIKEIK